MIFPNYNSHTLTCEGMAHQLVTDFHHKCRPPSTSIPMSLVSLFNPYNWLLLLILGCAYFRRFCDCSRGLVIIIGLYPLQNSIVTSSNLAFIVSIYFANSYSLWLPKVQHFLHSYLEPLLLPYTNSLGVRIIYHGQILLNYGSIVIAMRIISLV